MSHPIHQSWNLSVDRGPTSAYHHYLTSDQRLIDHQLEQLTSPANSPFHARTPTLMINDSGVSVSLSSLKNKFEHSFTQGEIERRSLQRAETLCKVTGANRGDLITILDATAGLGREAYLMASCGAQVFAFERALPLYLLTRNALSQAPHDFHLSYGDSVDRWCQHNLEADVIYLDPMFPTKNKRAAVGREAQILQAFALPDPQRDESLLIWALDSAYRRVVVKRPIKAPPLPGPRPTATVKGKAVRFDLYGKRKLPKK